VRAVTLSLFAILSLTPSAHAEKRPEPPGFFDPGVREAERPRNMVLADLGLHVIGLGYQRTLAPRFAVQMDADFYAPWTQYKNPIELAGIILRGRAFYYPLASSPAGLWLSPFAQYGVGWALRDGERRTSSVWAAGASVGYAFLFGHAVLLAVGGGGQFHAAHVLGGDGPPSFARFGPTLDLNLGYAF